MQQRADIIDLSSNNPQIDFQLVAKTGVKAALHKATEGVGYVDDKCLSRLAQAKAAGLKTGAYHYLRIRHGKPQDAREQAHQYLAIYRAANCEMLPCVDVETAFNEGVSQAEACEAVLAFIDEIRLAGLNCIIYTSHGEWTSMGLSVLTRLSTCPLWIAAYGPSAIAPRPWKTFAAWQWSGSGAMSGVVGPVDLSQCDGLGPLLKPNLTKLYFGIAAALAAAAAAYHLFGK